MSARLLGRPRGVCMRAQALRRCTRGPGNAAPGEGSYDTEKGGVGRSRRGGEGVGGVSGGDVAQPDEAQPRGRHTRNGAGHLPARRPMICVPLVPSCRAAPLPSPILPSRTNPAPIAAACSIRVERRPLPPRR
ncbi:hypothetical protein B0H19DRAFT_1277325 [Mycena capillaripes]|nr:hypothetical protein B0H19DRAFT_1277325 [Mycena capillaripes]